MHVIVEILDADDVDDPCTRHCHIVKTTLHRDVERAMPIKVISLVESLVLLLKKYLIQG
jgi:hypothetical protein